MSNEAETTPSKELDLFGQEIRAFVSEIARARHMGINEMEVSKEIIDHYNPKGLGGANYFIFQDVKVYPIGELRGIQDQEKITLEQKLNGSKGRMIGLD